MEKYEDNEKYQCGLTECKEKIIDMIHNINDTWVLEQIYRCIKNITKED